MLHQKSVSVLYEVAKDDISKKALDSVFLDSFSLEKKSKASFRDFFDVPSNYKDDCSSYNHESRLQADSQLDGCNQTDSKDNISDAWDALNNLTHNSQNSNDEIAIMMHTEANHLDQQAQINGSHQTLFGVSDQSSKSPIQNKLQSPVEYMEGTVVELNRLRDATQQNSFDIIELDMASHHTQKDQTRPSETETKDVMSVLSTPSRPNLLEAPTHAQMLQFDMRKRQPADKSQLNLLRPADAEVPQENACILIPASHIPLSMMSKNSKDSSIDSQSNAT